jgi:hypothetical protein
MNELLLINPRKRRGRKTAAKRGAGGRFVKARASNPAPRKRKRISRKRAHNPISTVRRHVAKHRSRARRHNPIKGFAGMGGLVNSTIMPGFIGAAGALGLDLLLGIVPLPVAVKTGPMKYLVKGAAAIAVGALGGMVLPRATAHKMAVGALTVTLHDFMKEQTVRLFPALPLGDVDGLGYYSPGYAAGSMLPDNSADSVDGMGFYADQSLMGEYVESGSY